MTSNKIIIILTTNPFPVGLAGTNRILSYCKGFLYHGFQPEVLCIKPTEPHNNVFNPSVKGTFYDIKYAYVGGTTIRVASFLRRRINDLTAFILTLKTLVYLLKRNKISFIIFYGNYIFTEIACLFLTSLFRAKIYKEESENPNVYFAAQKSFATHLCRWFSINKLYSYYSGVLVMTHPLKDFFLDKGIQDKKILVVPQTVDLTRFENEISDSTFFLPNEYIAYVGSLNQQKDGVLTLVESFLEVSAKYPEIHLIIAGDGTQQEKDILLLLIEQLNLVEKVHAIGRIAAADIPAFLRKAKLLASCRPKSMQSDYGFPTKIVEYLATGKPTVTTATGELAFYIKDRETAFIADLADCNAFSSKMMEVLYDYNFALTVAQNAKELVRDKFNPVKQAKLIIDFCNQ